MDLRRRIESAWSHIEERLYGTMILDHHAQPAIVGGIGRRSQPVADLFLEHKDHLFKAMDLGQEMKQQRGGDVIGQITDQAERAVVCT